MKLPIKKEWFKCPACGKKLVLFNNAASCKGVFIYCKKCRKDIEIKI